MPIRGFLPEDVIKSAVVSTFSPVDPEGISIWN
jgi:hypothetical protein